MLPMAARAVTVLQAVVTSTQRLMEDLDVLIKGIIAGLAISAPVGPVNVLCISRTLTKGMRAGIRSGIGAAAADTIYGAIAGFSVRFVIGFLTREEFWIRLAGGILLIAIGVRFYCCRPRRLKDAQNEHSTHSDLMGAFLLNLTNPTTVLSFMAVLTALGLHHQKSWLQGATLTGGIFAGAMLWWMLLAIMANHFRDRMTDNSMVWMNRVAGLAIGLFGVVTLALSRVS